MNEQEREKKKKKLLGSPHWEPVRIEPQQWQCFCGCRLFIIASDPKEREADVYLECSGCKARYGIDAPFGIGDIFLL